MLVYMTKQNQVSCIISHFKTKRGMCVNTLAEDQHMDTNVLYKVGDKRQLREEIIVKQIKMKQQVVTTFEEKYEQGKRQRSFKKHITVPSKNN